MRQTFPKFHQHKNVNKMSNQIWQTQKMLNKIWILFRQYKHTHIFSKNQPYLQQAWESWANSLKPYFFESEPCNEVKNVQPDSKKGESAKLFRNTLERVKACKNGQSDFHNKTFKIVQTFWECNSLQNCCYFFESVKACTLVQ